MSAGKSGSDQSMVPKTPPGQMAQGPQEPPPSDVEAQRQGLYMIVQRALQLEKDEKKKQMLSTLLKEIQTSNDVSAYMGSFNKALPDIPSLQDALDDHNLRAQAFQDALSMGVLRLGRNVPIEKSMLASQLEVEMQRNTNRYATLSQQLQDHEDKYDQEKKKLKANIIREEETREEQNDTLRKEIKKLKQENVQLQDTLELREKEIQSLKKQLKQLEEENRELERELKQVKGDLNIVKGDVKNLKQENEQLHSDLRKSEHTLNELRENVDKKFRHVENELKLTQATGAEALSENDTCLMALGEVFVVLQTTLYKKVHINIPLGDKQQRTIKQLERHLNSKYKNDPEEKKKAEERWQDLKDEIEWEEDYLDSIKDLKIKRNAAAHPNVDEDMLPGYVGYVAKLQKDNSISEDTARDAKVLIKMLCKLKCLTI